MSMKDQQNQIQKEKLRQAIQKVKDEPVLKEVQKKVGPYAKAGLYVAGGFIIIWASQFVFAAMAGAVRKFKDLRNALNGK